MMGNEPEIICGMVYSLVLACYVQNIPNDYDYLEKVYLDTADTWTYWSYTENLPFGFGRLWIKSFWNIGWLYMNYLYIKKIQEETYII